MPPPGASADDRVTAEQCPAAPRVGARV